MLLILTTNPLTNLLHFIDTITPHEYTYMYCSIHITQYSMLYLVKAHIDLLCTWLVLNISQRRLMYARMLLKSIT